MEADERSVCNLIGAFKLKVLFRADASIQQGTGHLMRCLVVADELRKRGHECIFVTQPFLPDFLEQIENRKHRLIFLQNDRIDPEDYSKNDEYLMWLGRSVTQDARETLDVIRRERTDIIITDHYAINATWMKIVTNNEIKTVIIDDLANKEYFCDILIDQNFGRIPEQYAELVSEKTTILAGAEYIFIKNDFKKNREAIQIDRLKRIPKCLNVCMGGMDKDNATFNVLEAVTKLDYFKNWSIDVVLRSSSPHSDMLKDYVETQKSDIKLHLDAEDMAFLFSKADLAIGAGGVTLWERCCIGLPTVLLTVADNQVPAALAMKSTGAIIYSGDIRQKNWESQLSKNLNLLTHNSETIHEMSRKAFDVCDGNGLDKVCDVIETM